MYKVSILVPVYGVETWIERCSRSLLGQTYPNLEFVFVDDCSPDKSMEILRHILEEYPSRKNDVKIIRHDKRRGLATARNSSLEASTGKFVLIVDSDDWIEPDAVDSLVKQQMLTGADIIDSQRIVHYQNEELLLDVKEYKDKEERVLHMMQRGWSHFVTGKLIQKSLFSDHSLHWVDGCDWAEDRYIMSLVSFYAQRWVMMSRVVYHYERRNANAMTMIGTQKNILNGNDQQYRNCLQMELFFQDKDPVYVQESRRCVMKQLEMNLRYALALSAKVEFEEIVRHIDSRSHDDWAIIGWTITGFKGKIMHNYRCMRIRWLANKIIRFIKKE